MQPPGHARGTLGEALLGQAYLGGSPYPVDLGRAVLGGSFLGGWVFSPLVHRAFDTVPTTDHAGGVGPLVPEYPQTFILGGTALGTAQLGGVVRKVELGHFHLGQSLLGGQLRVIVRGATDQAFTTDMAQAAGQPGDAFDMVLTSDSALLPAQSAGGFDQALSTDSTLLPSQSAGAFDISATSDVINSFLARAEDIALLFDFASQPIVIPSPTPGSAQVVIIPANPVEGTAVQIQVQFSSPEPGVPTAQWPPLDPDVVTLTWTAPNEDPVTWTYGSGMNIKRYSTGLYYALLDSSDSPGRWLAVWRGSDPCSAVMAWGWNVETAPAFLGV